MKTTKKGFTLFELLLMVIIISIGILAIIVALNNGLSFMQKTRERTIAVNLAREWMEAMFQIRDTNWQRRWGKKEECRLKLDPLKLEGGDCSQDNRMKPDNYILSSTTNQGQEYFVLAWWNTALDLSNGIDTGDRQFSLCETTGNIRYACPWTNATTKEGTFFRQIRGLWLFRKDQAIAWGVQIDCNNWSDATICGNATIPKEYRFCSEVQYIGKWRWTVTLCGLLTNFQKK